MSEGAPEAPGGASRLRLVQYPGLGRRGTLSPPCGKVHMALVLKGLAYDVISCVHPGQVRRFNPRGRVPVLLADGEVLVESSEIVGALDARFPDPPLLPEGPSDRARARVLEGWADETLYFLLVYLRWIDANGFARMKERVLSRLPWPLSLVAPFVARREARRRARGQGVGLKGRDDVLRELAGALDALESLAEGGPFLLGERVTRADLAVAAVVDQLRLAELTTEAAGEVERRASVVAWLERLHRIVPNAATL